MDMDTPFLKDINCIQVLIDYPTIWAENHVGVPKLSQMIPRMPTLCQFPLKSHSKFSL